MDVQKRNDVSIYCLSAGTTLPEWMGDRARRNLAKSNEGVRRRIDLLQDFQFPSSSSKLVQSPDGQYIMAVGTYPPRLRCYDVSDLTMKFERYINAEALDIVMLGEDYGKLAMLQDDRTIAFHAHYGAHESIRIPTFGRAMGYETTTCELLIASKGNRVYRINLEEGRFSEPWTFDADASGCSICINPQYPLAAVGCDDGMVRLWDSRHTSSRQPFLNLNVTAACVGKGYADQYNRHVDEISSLAFDSTGMYMAAGTGGGLVSLYDVRSSRPLFVQEHKLGLPIHTVQFHASSGMILSSDENLIKAWRYKPSTDSLVDTETNSIGSVKVNIEGTGKLSHFIVAGDESSNSNQNSGLILCATDQPKMDSFFVPALGVAPKWCSFLDSITEELEERDLNKGNSDDLLQSGQESIFENYKFVSRDDLEKLGISNLIGTPLLRGYMHGFFMDINLYNRVKAVANPFEYEEYQKKKLKERLDAKQSSRIAPRSKAKKKKTDVNPDLADRLEHKATSTTKAGKVAQGLLSDNRFGSLFTNPDFQIDEEEEDFKLRNPSGVAAINRRKDNMDSDDEDDEEQEEVGQGEHYGEDDSDSDLASTGESDDSKEEDGFRGARVRGEAYETMKELGRKQRAQTKRSKKSKKSKTIVQETEELDDFGETGVLDTDQLRSKQKMPLGKRKALLEQELADKPLVRMQGGIKEATFIPMDSKRKEHEKQKQSELRGSKRNRRGVKELGLKKI